VPQAFINPSGPTHETQMVSVPAIPVFSFLQPSISWKQPGPARGVGFGQRAACGLWRSSL